MMTVKPMRMQPRRRRLSRAEKRLLARKARELRTKSAAPRRILLLTLAVVGVLWLATLLASDAPWWTITLFWVAAGSVLALWTWREARGDAVHIHAMAQQLDSAIERDEAEVFDFAARAYVEFEEVEDEGACYAFDIGADAVAFVVGQEFYAEARFPSMEFSLVYPLDTSGNSADLIIDKRGPRAEPLRVVPRAVKLKLEIPEHLTVVRASLARIEEELLDHSESGTQP